jgi:hypothetical protein
VRALADARPIAATEAAELRPPAATNGQRAAGGHNAATTAAIDLAPLAEQIDKQQQTIMELAGRVGWLQAKNAEIEDKVKPLTAGEAPTPTEPARRPRSARGGGSGEVTDWHVYAAIFALATPGGFLVLWVSKYW